MSVFTELFEKKNNFGFHFGNYCTEWVTPQWAVQQAQPFKMLNQVNWGQTPLKQLASIPVCSPRIATPDVPPSPSSGRCGRSSSFPLMCVINPSTRRTHNTLRSRVHSLALISIPQCPPLKGSQTRRMERGHVVWTSAHLSSCQRASFKKTTKKKTLRHFTLWVN